MKRLVVTGGLGFLGANFLRWWYARYPRAELTNIDCLTYAGSAGNPGTLRSAKGYREHRLNIVGLNRLRGIWPRRPVTVVHFAAETHVDRSLIDAQPFARTNVLGTHTLLELAREFPVKRLIVISTDEVYGPAPKNRKFTESQPLNPSNPYAASKASADLLSLAYRCTYDVPVIVLRSVNVYGPRQYPEKFIPLFVTNALAGSPLPLYGNGRQERDWLWVDDFCAAVGLLIEARAPAHPIYHIAARHTLRNIDVAKQIVELTGCSPALLRKVADRPGHDRRYALDDSRFRQEFGWRPQTAWPAGIRQTVAWYARNKTWVSRRMRRSYLDYYRRQYHWRLNG
jgi:dTDP-glucose 4,6-dehydratase